MSIVPTGNGRYRDTATGKEFALVDVVCVEVLRPIRIQARVEVRAVVEEAVARLPGSSSPCLDDEQQARLPRPTLRTDGQWAYLVPVRAPIVPAAKETS